MWNASKKINYFPKIPKITKIHGKPDLFSICDMHTSYFLCTDVLKGHLPFKNKN